VGSTRQREGEGSGVPVRGKVSGPRVASGAGPKRCPQALLFYFFVLFLFSFLISISFVSFAKRLQFKSNHFQKFSKIQNNHPEQ
jgi:hypothetical protein